LEKCLLGQAINYGALSSAVISENGKQQNIPAKLIARIWRTFGTEGV